MDGELHLMATIFNTFFIIFHMNTIFNFFSKTLFVSKYIYNSQKIPSMYTLFFKKIHTKNFMQYLHYIVNPLKLIKPNSQYTNKS